MKFFLFNLSLLWGRAHVNFEQGLSFYLCVDSGNPTHILGLAWQALPSAEPFYQPFRN